MKPKLTETLLKKLQNCATVFRVVIVDRSKISFFEIVGDPLGIYQL